MRTILFSRRPASSSSHLAAGTVLCILLTAACSDVAPEPGAPTHLVEAITASDASSATAADPGTAVVVVASVVDGGSQAATVCGLVPDGQDIGDNRRAIFGAGWQIALIEPTEDPVPFREPMPSFGSPVAVGTSFRARVIDAIGHVSSTPLSVIEVHQWNAVVRGGRSAPMEEMNGARGRSMPRVGARFLAVLSPDNVLSGWRLVRSWGMGTDGAIPEAAVGFPGGTIASNALTSLRAEVAPAPNRDMWADWLDYVARRSGAGRAP